MACKTFHKAKYFVTFKRGFDDCKKDITVTVYKVFESDSLKITLSDDDDPSFLCILNVTRCDYEDLKKQQGLLIDFDNFPSQLVRLLQQCASNNMFLIMEQTNPMLYHFEIVEHNEFKRLIHLSLRTGPANDNDIKAHMAATINELKKLLGASKSSSLSNEAILNDKVSNMERRISDLTKLISKMEDDKIRRENEVQEMMKADRERQAQERLQWQKNLETHSKTQLATTQETINKKDKQIDELHNSCKQLRDNIAFLEKQLSEKSHRLNSMETELQKYYIEVASLQAKNVTLDRDAAESEKKYKNLVSKCTYFEKTIQENSDIIKDLNNSLQSLRREKLNLEERLAISESLINKNNAAANSTAEQLLKANQIISKQNNDLIEMKEKLLCRTAIALEQEKVIERNTKEIEELKAEVSTTKQKMEKLDQELETIKEKYENNEKALQDRDETIRNNNMVIQWLHKKMEGNYVPSDPMNRKCGIISAVSSTPYLEGRSNPIDSTESHSDESINFYATSKMSSIDNDSCLDTQKKQNKTGIDPKYLKPADDKQSQRSKDSVKSKPSQSRGKENNNIDLPKVDYREKKSARPASYRATPVSAYFP